MRGSFVLEEMFAFCTPREKVWQSKSRNLRVLTIYIGKTEISTGIKWFSPLQKIWAAISGDATFLLF